MVMVIIGLSLAGCATFAPTPDIDSEGALRNKLQRADLALREARLIDAEILYRELSVSHPRLPEVWLQLGNIYTRQAQLEAAMLAYKGGLQYASDDGRLWHNLALVELKQALLTLETASEVLPVGNPFMPRIRQLHRSLINNGGVDHQNYSTSDRADAAP